MPGRADPERDAAKQDWEKAFRSSPPPYLSVAFMRRAVAYEAQCKASGGLPAATARALRQIAEGKPASEVRTGVARPGTHLVREWNGRTYQVEVEKDCFRMDGRAWTSLSAIARDITGATWSGPRFFGLTGQARGGGQA